MIRVPAPVVQRLYASADAARWSLPVEAFADALAASAAKAFAGRTPDEREVERYVGSLHLTDLAVATACVHGVDAAWEHLIREYRPALYRAADAIDATGRARELADALWADLFGTLFRYFHGRSSLATWLRAVLAQRHIDAIRASRRLEALPDEEQMARAAAPAPEPGVSHCQALVQRALEAAVAGLEPRDRLRLACYHAQQLTLAETGRVLREHEATVSRHLARTRRTLRQSIEQWLEHTVGLPAAEVQRCLQAAVDDPGPLDLGAILAEHADDRKIRAFDRSKRGVV